MVHEIRSTDLIRAWKTAQEPKPETLRMEILSCGFALFVVAVAFGVVLLCM